MIKTNDVIKKSLESNGKSYSFKNVENLLKLGLAKKLDDCLLQFDRTYSFTYTDWKIRVSKFAGRTLIMFIAPDKDWISFVTDTGGTGQRCGFQGVHFEDEPKSKFYDFTIKLLKIDDFSEIAVDEPTMRIG